MLLKLIIAPEPSGTNINPSSLSSGTEVRKWSDFNDRILACIYITKRYANPNPSSFNSYITDTLNTGVSWDLSNHILPHYFVIFCCISHFCKFLRHFNQILGSPIHHDIYGFIYYIRIWLLKPPYHLTFLNYLNRRHDSSYHLTLYRFAHFVIEF